MSEETNKNCPCTWDCPRHGKCKECQAYHKNHDELTACGK